MKNRSLENWEIKTLSELCDLQNGFAFSSKDYVEHSNTLNIRMSNIRPNGTFDEYHNIKYLPDDYADKYKDFILNDGDLIIAMTDMAGDPKILGVPTVIKHKNNNQRFLMNQRVGKLFNISNKVNISFLKYFLISPEIRNYYKTKGKGGLQLNISKKDILSIEIKIPPLAEQERIVKILDNAFKEIEDSRKNALENITKAQILFQNSLHKLFITDTESWTQKNLNDICDLQNGFAFSSKDYVEYSNTLNIRMSNIRPNGTFDEYHNIKYLPDDYADKYKDFILNDGDLIIAMTDMAGDPKILGVPTVIKHKNNNQTFLMNQRVGKLFNISNKVNISFLKYFLISPEIRNYYKTKGKGGLQLNISKKDILSMEIKIPPLAEQERIVTQLDELHNEIKKLELTYNQKIKTLDELKESILYKAFNGDL